MFLLEDFGLVPIAIVYFLALDGCAIILFESVGVSDFPTYALDLDSRASLFMYVLHIYFGLVSL